MTQPMETGRRGKEGRRGDDAESEAGASQALEDLLRTLGFIPRDFKNNGILCVSKLSGYKERFFPFWQSLEVYSYRRLVCGCVRIGIHVLAKSFHHPGLGWEGARGEACLLL